MPWFDFFWYTENLEHLAAFLNGADNRPRAQGDVIWALMNTTEFGVNH